AQRNRDCRLRRSSGCSRLRFVWAISRLAHARPCKQNGQERRACNFQSHTASFLEWTEFSLILSLNTRAGGAPFPKSCVSFKRRRPDYVGFARYTVPVPMI